MGRLSRIGFNGARQAADNDFFQRKLGFRVIDVNADQVALRVIVEDDARRDSPTLGAPIFAVQGYAGCVHLSMVFIELSPFRACAEANWSDDALRQLQAALIA